MKVSKRGMKLGLCNSNKIESQITQHIDPKIPSFLTINIGLSEVYSNFWIQTIKYDPISDTLFLYTLLRSDHQRAHLFISCYFCWYALTLINQSDDNFSWSFFVVDHIIVSLGWYKLNTSLTIFLSSLKNKIYI